MSTSISTVSTTPAHDSAASSPSDQDDPGSSPSRGTADKSAAAVTDEPPPEASHPELPEIDLLGIDLLRTEAGHELNWIESLRSVLAHITEPITRVSICFVNDETMSTLHRQYCNVEGTTDVLTFDSTSTDGATEIDIAVCVDVAAREAVRHGHPVDEELILYTLHGVLHCIGFDDHTTEDHQTMHAEEDRILEAAGISARFHTNQAEEDAS